MIQLEKIGPINFYIVEKVLSYPIRIKNLQERFYFLNPYFSYEDVFYFIDVFIDVFYSMKMYFISLEKMFFQQFWNLKKSKIFYPGDRNSILQVFNHY